MGWLDVVNLVVPIKGAKEFDDLATKAQDGVNHLADQGEKTADQAIAAAEGMNDRMTDQFDAATKNTPLAVLQPVVDENRKMVKAGGEVLHHAAHFQGGLDKGLVDGALQLVDLPAQLVDGRLIGGMKDLGSAFLKNPGATYDAIKSSVVTAYQKDPDDFTGQVLGQVAVAVVGTKGTTAVLSGLKGASAAGDLARGAEAAGDASDAARAAQGADDASQLAKGAAEAGHPPPLPAEAPPPSTTLRGFGQNPVTKGLLARIRAQQGVEGQLQSLPLEDLPQAQQAEFRALFTGKLNPLSQRARVLLQQMVNEPGWYNLSRQDQLARLMALAKSPELEPFRVEVGLQSPARRLWELENVRQLPDGTRIYNLHLHGLDHPIGIMDEGAPVEAGLVQHSVRDVADAIADMPDEAFLYLKQVRLARARSPYDALNAPKGEEDFRAYMTAPVNGEIPIHPLRFTPSADMLRLSLLHEVGHGMMGTLEQAEAGSPILSEWANAMKADTLSTSIYGDHNLEEDAAETLSLYLAIRGSPLLDEYAAMMPNRFKLLM